MLLLDITVVNVALPDIQRDLHANFSELQWVVDAYSLMLAALLLTAGLARRPARAPARVRRSASALFTLASLACGLANRRTLPEPRPRRCRASAARSCSRTSLALIAQEFQGRERGTAFGDLGRDDRRRGRGRPAGRRRADGDGSAGSGSSSSTSRSGSAPIVARDHQGRASRATRTPSASTGPAWPRSRSALFLLVFALIRGNAEGWGSALIVVAARRRRSSCWSRSSSSSGAGPSDARPRPVPQAARSRAPRSRPSRCRRRCSRCSSTSRSTCRTCSGYSPLEAGVRFLPLTLSRSSSRRSRASSRRACPVRAAPRHRAAAGRPRARC